MSPPPIPEDIDPNDLDRDIRAELRGLPKPRAEQVARHLVAAGELLDEDPEAALAHALAARRSAARIAAVREAVGLAAYRAGQWHTAVAELRTYHRISGRQTHLAVVADCERAQGRPERALDLYRTADREKLAQDEAIELLIVAAGARRDLGQLDVAVAMLQVPELEVESSEPWVARLRYAYADALVAADRRDEAREWFGRAAMADDEDATDAAERMLDLDGVVIDEEALGQPEVPGEDTAALEEHPEAPGAEAEPFPPERLAEPQFLSHRPETADLPLDDAVTHPPEGAGPHQDRAVVAEPEDVKDQASEPESAESAPRLVDPYDLVILDLDGVVYVGDQAIGSAVAAVARLRRDQIPVVFATNNASRSPQQVAELLTGLGIAATAAEVLTSAAVAADTLVDRLPAGSAVLVVGTESLAEEVRRVGLEPVRSADARPQAVVQGYGPRVGWADLAEAYLAIDAGALWVATNTDATLPSPRGLLPGNGSLVAALRAALRREPDLVVGKPQAAFFEAAARRSGAKAPLVVGDRLDTDIAGAYQAGMASLLVLTGVDDAAAASAAEPEQRPDFVGPDLGALFGAAAAASPQPAGSPDA